MVIEKAHYKLDEAVEILGQTYKQADLIYLGAHEDLPIYVLAADWDVGVCIRGEADGIADDTGVSPDEWRPFKATFSDRLNGLQCLHAKTLSKFEAEPHSALRNFLVEWKNDENVSKLYEYQLGENLDGLQNIRHTITANSLVVMAEHVAVLREQVKAFSEKPPTTKEWNTLLKLVLGMAMRGYGYDPNAKRNSATREISDDIHYVLGTGLDPDTVKKWLDIAAKTHSPKEHKG